MTTCPEPQPCPSCGSLPESLTRCALCGSDGPGVIFTPFEYRPQIIGGVGLIKEVERNLQGLDWKRHGSTPRMEYYHSVYGLPYRYGVPEFARTYESQPLPEVLHAIWQIVEDQCDCRFDVVFLNRYLNQSDHLGWHSDNSPEMDDARPIAIVSLGVERHIDFRRVPVTTSVISNGEARMQPPDPAVHRLKLGNGSLCIMRPGMQDTHQHRIPKAGFQCGERISLTFRGYVKPPEFVVVGKADHSRNLVTLMSADHPMIATPPEAKPVSLSALVNYAPVEATGDPRVLKCRHTFAVPPPQGCHADMARGMGLSVSDAVPGTAVWDGAAFTWTSYVPTRAEL